MDHYFKTNKPLVIGHRGAKGHVAENTLASIQKALDLGVQGIEVDVHCCKSGELVVFHDFTVDRLTNASGEITSFTLLELKKLKVEGLYEIPTLIEVLDLIDGKCILNVELKGHDTAFKTSKTIECAIKSGHWSHKKIIVSSFQYNLLIALHKINKTISLGVLTDTNLTEAIDVAKQLDAIAIHPNYTMLSANNVAKIKEEGLKVLAWTVNTPEAIERLISYNVDGIISDFPDRI